LKKGKLALKVDEYSSKKERTGPKSDEFSPKWKKLPYFCPLLPKHLK
jgi:hypothetical protein